MGGAQTIPDLEKILKLGELFGVTTDYLLKDEIENEDYTDGVSEPGIRKITLMEANEIPSFGWSEDAAYAIGLLVFSQLSR